MRAIGRFLLLWIPPAAQQKTDKKNSRCVHIYGLSMGCCSGHFTVSAPSCPISCTAFFKIIDGKGIQKPNIIRLLFDQNRALALCVRNTGAFAENACGQKLVNNQFLQGIRLNTLRFPTRQSYKNSRGESSGEFKQDQFHYFSPQANRPF